MFRKFFAVCVILVSLCSSGFAADAKLKVAVIDFTDGTPHEIPIKAVMKCVDEALVSADIFELLPREQVEAALQTALGREAQARNYDAFSSARLGKELGADALLVGSVLQFEKDVIPHDMKVAISGIEITKRRGADVLIEAHLLDTKTGGAIANGTGEGKADEGELNTILSFVNGELSRAFLFATRVSAHRMTRELKDSLTVSGGVRSQNPVSTSRFVVVKVEKDGVYINAGRNRDVSIGDIFDIYSSKNESETPVATARLVELSEKGSRLALVHPKTTDGVVFVGDRIKKK